MSRFVGSSVAAFLEHPASVGTLLRDHGSVATSCCVMTDSWAVQQEARAAGLSCSLVDDLLDASTADDANRTVDELRRSWFLSAGQDFTAFCGVSLGNLLEYEFSYAVMFPLARMLYSVTRWMTQRRLHLLVTDAAPETPTSRALAALAGCRNTRFGRIARPRGTSLVAPHYRIDAPTQSLTASVRTGAKRLASRALSVLAAPAGLTAGKRDGRALFYYYPSLLPIFDAWVDQGLGPAMVFDPSALPPTGAAVRYLRAGARVLRVAQGPEADARLAITEVQQRWRRVREDNEWWSTRAVCGVSLREILGPILDTYVTERLPHLAQQVGALESAFVRSDVSCVVVPFDAPERSRMLVRVAATRGIPSVVLQHGLAVSAHLDNDKSLADHVLVWSRPVRDQLVSWGHDARRIHVVGNPVFDRYALETCKVLLQARGAPPTVLVMTATSMNFNVRKDTTISERYLRLVLHALARLDRRPRVVLRPHPAERPDFYRRLLASWGESIDEIAAVCSFAECVAIADVIVSPVSTGVLEAWLAGKAVIVVSDCAWGVDYPLDGSTEIPAVAAPGQLVEALAKALALRDGGPVATRSSRLSEYCGPLDGRSALRAVEFIDRLRRGDRPSVSGEPESQVMSTGTGS